jgi:hypothetical protein
VIATLLGGGSSLRSEDARASSPRLPISALYLSLLGALCQWRYELMKIDGPIFELGDLTLFVHRIVQPNARLEDLASGLLKFQETPCGLQCSEK